MCIRKGIVMSSSYFRPSDVEVEGSENLTQYQFGDKDVGHFFCRTCGIAPFHKVASVPADYAGPARPGDYRVNLGSVDELDVLSLDIDVIDGRSL